MKQQALILGIGGTPRAGSSSEKALRLCLAAAQAEGARTEIVCGDALDLPLYEPGGVERSAKAQRMVSLFRQCDGIVIASPAYHGSISGVVKNALDYTEDLSRDERVYFDGCAAGLIACGAGWQGASQTLQALRAVAHSLRAWPTPMGAMLNTASPVFDASGTCLDASAAFQLKTVGQQVARFALRWAPAEARLAEAMA